MTKLTIINDTHLGVTRTAGTTKESQERLTRAMLFDFNDLLESAEGTDLLINGDLFDRFDVDKQVEFLVFGMLLKWLRENADNQLILAAGNHDLSKDSPRRSSFTNLCKYLSIARNGDERLAGLAFVDSGLYEFETFAVIPHMPNQELFEAELDKALQLPIHTLFLHCNFDNHFAAQTDHSLNLSAERAQQFAEKGVQLVLGHEHHGRHLGNVRIIGNQIPSSIADCLDPNKVKQYAVLEGRELTLHDFMPVEDVFAEVDWQTDTLPDKQFIRVTGEATYEQASEVVQRIAEWRKSSDAFVITNAVKVGTLDTQTALPDVQSASFDVWKMLLEKLPENLREFAEEVRNHE